MPSQGIVSRADGHSLHLAFILLRAGMAHENSAFGLHSSMFIPTIEKMGTEEQKEAWIPRSLRYEIIGTYAQTELGHGKTP